MDQLERMNRREEEARATVALHTELGHCENCPGKHWLRGCELTHYCMEEIHVDTIREEE